MNQVRGKRSEMVEELVDTNQEELQELILTTEGEVPQGIVYFAKVKPNAIIPSKREEDAGYDIFCADRTKTIVIKPNSFKMIDTGIAIACNKAWFPKFFDKGGMGSQGIIVSAGVGDSGYRDGYFVPLINTNGDKYLIITNQSTIEIDKCNYFDLKANKFIFIDDETIKKCQQSLFMNTFGENKTSLLLCIKKGECIIKPITKAITQFAMLPVPKLKPIEIPYEDLKNISSKRGLGKLGSSGK